MPYLPWSLLLLKSLPVTQGWKNRWSTLEITDSARSCEYTDAHLPIEYQERPPRPRNYNCQSCMHASSLLKSVDSRRLCKRILDIYILTLWWQESSGCYHWVPMQQISLAWERSDFESSKDDCSWTFIMFILFENLNKCVSSAIVAWGWFVFEAVSVILVHSTSFKSWSNTVMWNYSLLVFQRIRNRSNQLGGGGARL